MSSAAQLNPFRPLWMETIVIERLVYKNKPQQRRTSSFRQLKKMTKLLSSARSVQFECSAETTADPRPPTEEHKTEEDRTEEDKSATEEDKLYLRNRWTSAHLIAQALIVCQDAFLSVLQQLDIGLFLSMNLFLAASLSRLWVLCKACLAAHCAHYCMAKESGTQEKSESASGKPLPPCLCEWLLSRHGSRLWKKSRSFKCCHHRRTTPLTPGAASVAEDHGVSLPRSGLDLSCSRPREVTDDLFEEVKRNVASAKLQASEKADSLAADQHGVSFDRSALVLSCTALEVGDIADRFLERQSRLVASAEVGEAVHSSSDRKTRQVASPESQMRKRKKKEKKMRARVDLTDQGNIASFVRETDLPIDILPAGARRNSPPCVFSSSAKRKLEDGVCVDVPQKKKKKQKNKGIENGTDVCDDIDKIFSSLV